MVRLTSASLTSAPRVQTVAVWVLCALAKWNVGGPLAASGPNHLWDRMKHAVQPGWIVRAANTPVAFNSFGTPY